MEEMHNQTEVLETSSSSEHQSNWIKAQDELKRKLVTEDDFAWQLPSEGMGGGEDWKGLLKYVGGVDISFSKEDPSVACGTLVVLDLQSLNIVYDDYSVVRLQIPYIPGFLAFREAPILLGLLKKMKEDNHPFYPQLLMVDGNGLLHPRGFGLACHLGVSADIPSIGVGKNLHHVDGLTQLRVRELLEDGTCKEFVDLIGNSGHALGLDHHLKSDKAADADPCAQFWKQVIHKLCLLCSSVLNQAMKSTGRVLKPIFISIGHRISLATAIKVVKLTCKYRVPEPIRQADIKSRDYLRRHPFIDLRS